MGTGTFLLALLGVVLSSASLVWNFANFLLTGPRISVALTLGVTNDAGDQMRSWSIPTDRVDLTDELAEIDSTREVAVITVRNHGRAPATVYRAGISAGDRKGLHHEVTVAGIDGGSARLDPATYTHGVPMSGRWSIFCEPGVRTVSCGSGPTPSSAPAVTCGHPTTGLGSSIRR